MNIRENIIVNSLRKAISNWMHGGLDNKRKKSWCEYGYKEDLEFDDFNKAYRRQGIGFGAVKKVIDKCWSSYPEIYEGNESEKNEKQNDYEKKINATLNNKFWREFKEADKRRLIGRWSAIILYFNDNNQVGWADPVVHGAILSFVKASWSTALQVLETDVNGIPAMWNYTPPKVGNHQPQAIKIHASRVFVLGDMSPDGLSMLEPGFNNVVNIEKVEGGSAESYLKNSSRQLHINFDPDNDIDVVANTQKVNGGQTSGDNEFKGGLEKAARDLNAGNDTLLVTQGATSSPLVSAVPDPTPTYNINVMSFSTSIDIPIRILIGNQTGERATVEDLKYFNSSMQQRRVSDLSIEISDFIDKLISLRIFEFRAIGVLWDDLTTASKIERLDNAFRMAEINEKAMAGGSNNIFTESEIRAEAGYDTNADNSYV